MYAHFFLCATYCRYDIISGAFTPTNQNRTSFGCRLVNVKPLFTKIRFCTSRSSILKFSREMSLSRRLLNYYFCRLGSLSQYVFWKMSSLVIPSPPFSTHYLGVCLGVCCWKLGNTHSSNKEKYLKSTSLILFQESMYEHVLEPLFVLELLFAVAPKSFSLPQIALSCCFWSFFFFFKFLGS